jgi:hypothetical protein
VDPIIDYRRMLGIWKRRLFERGAEPVSADCRAGDDDHDHVLSNEEVEQIARSLIAEAPLVDDQPQEDAADIASCSDGWRITH